MKPFAVALASAFALSTSSLAAEAPDAAILDARISEGLDKLGVVGLGVAVWTPKGTYARGFGVTNVESGEKVSAETAFYIASSTKSFTALAMNILHHRGEIDLDSTLADFAQDAAFPVSVKPDQARLRDLLTHASGIENDHISFRAAFSGEHDPATMWRLLAASEPNAEAPLGSFQYTNTGYNILTVLTDRKLGKSWQDILADEIFTPAKMTRTSAYMSEAAKGNWSLARPHVGVGPDAPTRISLEKTDATMQSAGGMIMSANDAAKWLELMIADGSLGGKQAFPAQAVVETRARLVETSGEHDGYTREHYGLGWYVGRYRDEVLIHHFGGFAGTRAHISYMPERTAGVAVFANDSGVGGRFSSVVANYIYDMLAGRPDADETYSAAVTALAATRDNANLRIAADIEKRRSRAWALTRPRADYAGIYASDLAGTMTVAVDGEGLLLSIGALKARAEPFTEQDTVRVELVPGQGEIISFKTGAGGVKALVYDGTEFARRK